MKQNCTEASSSSRSVSFRQKARKILTKEGKKNRKRFKNKTRKKRDVRTQFIRTRKKNVRSKVPKKERKKKSRTGTFFTIRRINWLVKKKYIQVNK